MDKIKDFCQWKNCRNVSNIVYLGKGVCEKHWALIDKYDENKFRKKIGLKEAGDVKQKCTEGSCNENLQTGGEEGPESKEDNVCSVLPAVQKNTKRK